MYYIVSVMERHDFAKAWLKRTGNAILINGKNFFDINVPNTEIKSLKTYLVKGRQLEIKENDLEIISYTDMVEKYNTGIYQVTSGNLSWRRNQRCIYYLAKFDPLKPGFIEPKLAQKKGWILLRDPINKRLMGKGEDLGTMRGRYLNGNVTPWIDYEYIHHRRRVIKIYDSFSDAAEQLYDMSQGREPHNLEKVYLKEEVAVMQTVSGEIICIPRSLSDIGMVLPKVLIVGKRGKGKSWTLNRALGCTMYTYHPDRVVLLNDSLDQFYNVMLPNTAFVKELALIGNEPRPLPVINLFMSCPGVDIKYRDEQVGYRLVISFRDFLYRWAYWTNGVAKWKIGPPEKYFTKTLVEALNQCRTIEETRNAIFKIITDQMDGKLDDGKKAMIMKWVSTIEAVFRDQFTDNLFKHEEDTAAEWQLKMQDGTSLSGHPLIIAAEAGLVPIINNSFAKDKPVAKKQMADLLHKVIAWQMMRGKDKHNFWVFIDELKDFLGRSGDELYSELDYLFTQGRYNQVGF
jgi:hypothetical protein